MLKNEDIENYSGVNLKLHQLVPCLKRRHWRELEFNVGGDAPKNFLAIYDRKDSPAIRRLNVDTWPKYIAKVGHKWYPIESINEYLFNQLGEVLGITMAESRMVMIKGQLRFLSRYFLKPGKESLIHGAEIFAGFMSDLTEVELIEKQGLARKVFTFKLTKEAITKMFPDDAQEILENFVKMLVFDALTGNNDRHFYNWGVVKDIKSKNCPKFAPKAQGQRLGGTAWMI